MFFFQILNFILLDYLNLNKYYKLYYRYLNDQDIMHRDIKPENILIKASEDDEIAIVKIGDFGLSKKINKNIASDS